MGLPVIDEPRARALVHVAFLETLVVRK